MNKKVPTLSIGLAVRNGRDVIERCINSILSQDFTDFELVICDNVSDDGTIEILKRYADSDARIKLHLNPVNIGSHENMKLALDLSRGALFRFISADDWLEPGCLSACVRALERDSEAVGVTTWFTFYMPDGSTKPAEHRDVFPTELAPERRFARMLWVCHGAKSLYDPVYGIYRRQRLLLCRPLRPSERTDWLLSAELALEGRILNIEQRLANRCFASTVGIDRAAFRRRLDPIRGELIRTSPRRLYRQMSAIALSADLTNAQLRRCQPALLRFWYKETVRSVRNWLSDAKHRTIRRWKLGAAKSCRLRQ
jgi:glycosyltransferase involved in cell wall biosynthesis